MIPLRPAIPEPIFPNVPISLAFLLFLSFGLLSCGTSGGGSEKKVIDEGEIPDRAPTEGTIVYSDPKPKQGSSGLKRRLSPTLIKITTQSGEGSSMRDPIVVQKGRVREDAQGNQPTESVLSRELFQKAARQPVRTVSPEQFAMLWTELKNLGTFKLPKHRGGIPPEDKPSISVTTGGLTQIYLRPIDVYKGEISKEKFQELWASWENAKRTLTAGFSF